LFRRKKKSESAPPDEVGTAVVDAAPPDPQAGASDPVTAEEPVIVGAPDMPAPVDPARNDTAHDDAPEPGRAAFAGAAPPALISDGVEFDDLITAPAEAKQNRPRYQPQDVPLATPYGAEERLPVSYWVGGVKNVLTKSGTSSAEEREREAAAEFQAAIMPGLMGLRDAVPDAATPDDALRALAQREAEHDYPEDSEGLSLSQRDIFRTDASVYYRIRNRFEKPRRKVGWNNPWRPPPGLARPDPPRRALDRGE